tara:strand:- start:723 stop:842 length:120 start_codon:yes stop_codon:yes gene_type:complete
MVSVVVGAEKVRAVEKEKAVMVVVAMEMVMVGRLTSHST